VGKSLRARDLVFHDGERRGGGADQAGGGHERD